MGIQLTDVSGNQVSAEIQFTNPNQTTGATENKSALMVNTPREPKVAGYSTVACVRDKGTVTGYRSVDSVISTLDGRMETSLVTPLFTETFNYTAQDTGRWSSTLTTHTVAYTATGITLNSGNSVAASAATMFKSYWTHLLPTEGSIWFRTQAYLNAAPVANTTIEFGFLFASGTTAPTDGVFFRYDATGTLKGVCNYNGAELTTNALAIPSAGVRHVWEICVHETKAEFWIDGVLQDVVATPGTQPQPMCSGHIQVGFRQYNAASAPASSVSLKVVACDVFATDGFMGKSYQVVRCGMGHHASQGTAGGTMGSTANKPASGTAPTAAVPAIGAAVVTGLGGLVAETTTIAINTDGLLCSFQVPAGGVSQAGRKLVIYGVWINSVVTTVLAGGPFLNEYCLNYGHTALTLATTEAAAAKAPRRIPLGMQYWAATAAVGTASQGVVRQFSAPIVVNPGEYVSISTRNGGTVGTAGVITHVITFDAHWS